MPNFDVVDQRLDALLATVTQPAAVSEDEPLVCGLDLGTAFIVLVVLNAEGNPVACAYQFADVVRDGMVVNYMGACDITRALKEELEQKLGRALDYAAVAIPPGTESLDGGVVKNVAESAGFECLAALDEPSAANLLVGLADGAVVDIGGGTTGISVLQHGEVVDVVDEPTGGTHFSLVVAGAKNLPFADAELYKREANNHAEVLRLVAPTVDKVSSIVRRALARYEVSDVVVVGGTAELTGLEDRMSKTLGLPVTKPAHPMFVTPFGIALGCLEAACEQGLIDQQAVA